MTTTRRLLAAVAIAGSLVLPAGAASADVVATASPDPSGDVRVSVEISEREVPAGPRVVVGDGPFVVGGTIVVLGTGLAPRTTYEVWLESDPVLLGTVTTDADGALELESTIPLATLPGEHHIRLNAPGGGADVLSEPFVVHAAPLQPQEPGATPSGATSGTTGGGTQASTRPGGLATTGTGLAGVAALAGVAVTVGAVLRRRAGKGAAAS